MSRTRKLLGLSVVIAADTGIGIVAVKAFIRPSLDDGSLMILIAQYLAGFLLAVVLIDLDIVIHKFFTNQINSGHRNILHLPLIMIPLTVKFTAFTAPMMGGDPGQWARVAFVCTMGHLIHDSLGEANTFGVMWLWPFTKDYHLLQIDQKHQLTLVTHPSGAVNRLVPIQFDDWLRSYYLQPTPESVGGIVILIVAICYAILG